MLNYHNGLSEGRRPILRNAILAELAKGPGTVKELERRLHWGGGSVPVVVSRMFMDGRLSRERVDGEQSFGNRRPWRYSLPVPA